MTPQGGLEDLNALLDEDQYGYVKEDYDVEDDNDGENSNLAVEDEDQL